MVRLFRFLHCAGVAAGSKLAGAAVLTACRVPAYSHGGRARVAVARSKHCASRVSVVSEQRANWTATLQGP